MLLVYKNKKYNSFNDMIYHLSYLMPSIETNYSKYIIQSYYFYIKAHLEEKFNRVFTLEYIVKLINSELKQHSITFKNYK